MTGTASSSLAAVPTSPAVPAHAVEPGEPTGRPLRKDARRNRDLLLTVAAEQFSAHGVDVPLEEIARVAGVGIGTLYRHFPTRGALIEAVYRREVGQLCDSAEELLRTQTPDEALASWMRNFVAYASTKRGLSAALRDMMSAEPELFTDTRARIYAAANSVLAAAAADGAIRPDVDAEDLIRGMGGICMATDDDGYTERANKLMTLMLDGMRHGAGRAG